jgi:phospholipase C
MRVLGVLFFVLAVAGVTISGCGGSSSGPQFVANSTGDPNTSSSPSPIQHVVIVVQENRTFNDFFATYPGADGTRTGKVAANPNCSPPIKKGTIALAKMPLVLPSDLNHRYSGYHTAYDAGRMDGFDLIPNGQGIAECAYPYQYTDPSQIQPYWQMAQQYVLAEHMFTTQGSDSFTAHQDLIRGGTVVESGKAMVDLPSCGTCYWGCDAHIGTHTHLITQDNRYLTKPGPFPCSNKFKASYPTMRDLLDPKSISWKYYLPLPSKIYGKLLSAFDAIAAVRYGSEWKSNVVYPETQIFNDISNNRLPNVSWVIPEQNASDHPGTATDTGPQWVASIVNAIGQSSYWGSSAIVVVWDDWGGLYDNAKPQILDYGGLGFRVPAIIISPYARAGYVSPTKYEFGSILRYIEGNWNLGSLGTSDARATSILDSFNYHQTPIPFTPIQSSLSKEYFMHHQQRGMPDDDM